MPPLPSQSPTIDAIYSRYEQDEREARQRDYLGGSRIGVECRRALWYEFRHVLVPTHEGRVLRLFQTGHREEDRMIDNLRSVGVQVVGQQHEVTFCHGHGKGHFDGVCLGLIEAPKTWHLLECKTSGKKAFDKLVKDGVQATHPEHYAQMQIYMHLGELTRAYYMVHCKDDDRLYGERIKYDANFCLALLAKASAIIFADDPPARINSDPAFYLCRWCDYACVCHGNRIADVNCRTCVHSQPTTDGNGAWSCRRSLPMAPGCTEHLFIPSLVQQQLGEPIDGAIDWIEYTDVINVTAGGFPASNKEHRTSVQLMTGEVAND
jgi:hypothetical protein